MGPRAYRLHWCGAPYQRPDPLPPAYRAHCMGCHCQVQTEIHIKPKEGFRKWTSATLRKDVGLWNGKRVSYWRAFPLDAGASKDYLVLWESRSFIFDWSFVSTEVKVWLNSSGVRLLCYGYTSFCKFMSLFLTAYKLMALWFLLWIDCSIFPIFWHVFILDSWDSRFYSF